MEAREVYVLSGLIRAEGGNKQKETFNNCICPDIVAMT